MSTPFCVTCPDHEACMTGYPCEVVQAIAEAPPFDWTRMHHGICPKCGEDKFIGHGPLCTDCYLAGES